MRIKIRIKKNWLSVYGYEKIYQDVKEITDYGANIKVTYKQFDKYTIQNYEKKAIDRIWFLKEI